MTDARKGHPYFMHDAILAEPRAWAEVTARCAPQAADFAAGQAPGGRLYLVGTGTSLHAALVGVRLLAACGAEALAWSAFDFALFGPALAAADTVIVISHRGTKRYSLASLERAQAAGCRTLLLCGEQAPRPASPPDAVWTTVPQERSSAHTVSCMGSLAAMAALAVAMAAPRGHGLDLSAVPPLLAGAVALEPEVVALAGDAAAHGRFWLTGAGADAVVAAEIALKIQETSYATAAGSSVEALIHGPLQGADPGDFFVLIATAAAGLERLHTLSAMLADLGASQLWIGNLPPPQGFAGQRLSLPAATEPLGSLGSLVALQLLTYHLALRRRTDPDAFRLDDPRFARAAQRVRL